MGPAHDNELSPAIESSGVWASPDRAARAVNGESPFSPPRRQHSPFPARPPGSGRGSRVALWFDERTGPLELQVLFWALPMTSPMASILSVSFSLVVRDSTASFHLKNTSKHCESFINESGCP